MKLNIIIFAIFISLLIIVPPQSFATSNQINWQPFEQGLSPAAKHEKKIFLYFHADRCKYCVKMGNTTFKDATRINHLPGYVDGPVFALILKQIETDSFQKMSFQEFTKTL